MGPDLDVKTQSREGFAALLNFFLTLDRWDREAVRAQSDNASPTRHQNSPKRTNFGDKRSGKAKQAQGFR